jgi:hypothetical protein
MSPNQRLSLKSLAHRHRLPITQREDVGDHVSRLLGREISVRHSRIFWDCRQCIEIVDQRIRSRAGPVADILEVGSVDVAHMDRLEGLV